MELTGERRIPASREQVWAALTDPAVLGNCIPGCDGLTRQGDAMVGGATTPIGPIVARYTGRIVFTELDPPQTMRITSEVQGEAGFNKTEVAVRLTEAAPFTILSTALVTHGGGRVAQLGTRTTESAARSLLDQVLDRLAAEVGGSPATEVAAAGPAGVLAAAVNPRPATARPGGLSGSLAGGLTGPGGLLARLPAEPYGLPLVAWGGMAICAFLFLMIFKGYAVSLLDAIF